MDGLLSHLARILRDVYADEGVQIWLDSPNRNLHRERPSVLLAQGRHDEVLQEAERLSG